MYKNLQNKINPFLDEVFDFLISLDMEVSDLTIDHIGLRFSSKKDVVQLSKELDEFAQLLSRAVVNGRKISIYKLNTPFSYSDYKIPCIELPYPAENHNYPNDGWEHVEFVIPTTEPLDIESAFKKKFPHLSPEDLEKYGYNLAVPQVKRQKLSNPTVMLTKRKGLSIKFHPHSIEEIIASKY